ncbi:MAG: alpha/beta hydrolase [Fuerstiella sp.]
MKFRSAGVLILLLQILPCEAQQRLPVWPDLAPGETLRETGAVQPPRAGEDPPVTRITGVRCPLMEVFPADDPGGPALLVLPGGGFGKVVTNKEGSEAAPWLNQLGISVFVLRYRTSKDTSADEPSWQRPLQDAQRALRIIRSQATQWQINPDQVGVLGFSAGGQVAAILHTADGRPAYPDMDDADDQSCRPDFSLLIYPWQVLDPATGQLLPQIRVTETSPPAFLVHTHDDRSSSLGSVLIYAELKRHNIPAELHIYQNGGHGYGMRNVPGSDIGTWPDRATAWLRTNGWTH